MLTWQNVENFVIHGSPPTEQRVVKTGMQWRSLLPDDVYEVKLNAGTERPFSSPMCTHFEIGIYACACCDAFLFDSTEKV